MTALTYAPSDLCGGGEWWQFWKQMECGTGAGRPLASAAADLVADSVFQPWLEDAKKGVQDVFKAMITFWINVPDPEVETVDGTVSPVITFLQERLVWFGAVIMCFVVLFNAAKIMWEQNKAKPLLDVGKMVAVYLGVSTLLIPSLAVSLAVTNYVAHTILDLSTSENTNFADNLFGLFNNLAGVASAILVILLYICAMIISGLMCCIMIGRGATLFVVAGALLTQATAYATDSGKEGFMTSIGWLKGLLLYKVVAAAIFGVGFKFLSTDTNTTGNGLLQMLYGITLLLMAVFSLPACMRVCAPATAPVASGQGAGAAVMSTAPMLAAGALRR